MKKKYEPLFEPFTFPSGVTIDNRIAVAPMTHYSSNEDGTISDQELDYIIPRSKEMGIVITACANVTADGKAFPGQPAINQDSQISGLKKLAQAIQAQGSKAIVQIHHGGIECPPELVPNQEVVGASDIFDNGKQIVRALEDHEVENIAKAFGEATRRAIEAGFDGVEIHGANGYLIQQFYSPKTNQRTDRWGGSAEKRLAFPLAIVDEVKKPLPPMLKSPLHSATVCLRKNRKRRGLQWLKPLHLLTLLQKKNWTTCTYLLWTSILKPAAEQMKHAPVWTC